MFLSIASIALMGVLILNMNTSYLKVSDEAMYHSDYEIDAISICESYIELAIGKAYDENNITSYISDPTYFTPKGSLGHGSTETTIGQFDDFDDFNNYNDTVSTERGTFTVKIHVCYVDINNPDVESSIQTFNKKMRVTVTSPFMSDTLSSVQDSVYMDYIYSYF